MKKNKLWINGIVIFSLLGAGGYAQARPGASSVAPLQVAAPAATPSASSLEFWDMYRAQPWLAPRVQNPLALNRAAARGQLNLSLRQAVLLTLKDNLDLRAANFERAKAQADILRTASGAAARGTSGAVISNSFFSSAIGASSHSGAGNSGSGAGSILGGVSLAIPNQGSYDPSFSINAADIHALTPLNSLVFYGTPVDQENYAEAQAGYSQSFPTGTSVQISGSGFRDYFNSTSLLFNPEVATSLSVGIGQNLLQGFGKAANRGFMIVARNDTGIATAVFRNQVMRTAAKAANCYWALAQSEQDDVLARDTVASLLHLRDDTLQLVRAGRKPQSDLIQVESQLAQARQAAFAANTQYRTKAIGLLLRLSQQLSPALLSVHVEASSGLPRGPSAGASAWTLPRAISLALQNSPQIAKNLLNLKNDRIALAETRNALLPSLFVGGSYTVSGLSGLRSNCAVAQLPCPAADVRPPLPGGVTQALNQSLHATYPDYGAVISLSFTLRNRQARADNIRAGLELSQQRIKYEAARNQAAQKAAIAYIAWRNAAAGLRQALRSLRLARQALENQKTLYHAGRATILDVLTAENASIQAAEAAIAARAVYAEARVNLDRRTGAILARFHVRIQPAHRIR